MTGLVLRDGATGRQAPYSDDTQMVEILLRGLLDCLEAGKGLEPTMKRIGRGSAVWTAAAR